MRTFPRLSKHCGFTLLELIVVVSIMAIIGGAMITGFGGAGGGEGSIRRDAQLTAARHEMQQIRNSLLQYQADNLEFPNTDLRSSPADIEFLLSGADDWDPEYQTGWRGPYISSGDNGEVDIGDSMEIDAINKVFTGNGNPFVVTTGHEHVRAIPDPFGFKPVRNNYTSTGFSANCNEDLDANNLCLMDWRLIGQPEVGINPETGEKFKPHSAFGRPYLLFDLNLRNKARIISMGPNGRYDSAALTTPCTGPNNSDDLVLCLF